MKSILMSLCLFSVINLSESLAAIGCGPNICDPANSCYEGCPGNVPFPGNGENKYTMSGQCTVEKNDATVTAKFSLQNDQKAILRVNEQLKIDVINNAQISLSEDNYVAAMAVSTIQDNETTRPLIPSYTQFTIVPNKASSHVIRESALWANDLQESSQLILGRTKVQDSYVSCKATLKMRKLKEFSIGPSTLFR